MWNSVRWFRGVPLGSVVLSLNAYREQWKKWRAKKKKKKDRQNVQEVMVCWKEWHLQSCGWFEYFSMCVWYLKRGQMCVSSKRWGSLYLKEWARFQWLTYDWGVLHKQWLASTKKQRNIKHPSLSALGLCLPLNKMASSLSSYIDIWISSIQLEDKVCEFLLIAWISALMCSVLYPSYNKRQTHSSYT